jgi:hypothetical protein
MSHKFSTVQARQKFQHTTYIEMMPQNRLVTPDLVCGATKRVKLLPIYSKSAKILKNTKTVTDSEEMFKEH